jgi:hypothetical protein
MATLSTRSKPPVSLALIDLTDTREKPDADPVRGDYDLDRRAGGRRQGVLPTLAAWTRLVDGELWDEAREHDPLAETPTVASECGFLLTHLEWIVEQQWANEIADDVRRIRLDLMHAVGERDAEKFSCETCGWEMEPQGDYDQELKRYPWYRCTGCHATLTTAAEVDRLSADAADYVTLKYAAKQLGKDWATLRSWKKQGWIKPVGRDQRGSIYSLNAIRGVSISIQKGVRFSV